MFTGCFNFVCRYTTQGLQWTHVCFNSALARQGPRAVHMHPALLSSGSNGTIRMQMCGRVLKSVIILHAPFVLYFLLKSEFRSDNMYLSHKLIVHDCFLLFLRNLNVSNHLSSKCLRIHQLIFTIEYNTACVMSF